jgi:alcohol dehydrogenase
MTSGSAASKTPIAASFAQTLASGLSLSVAAAESNGKFDFQPFTRVVFGVGAIDQIGQLSREYGGRRVLVVSDPHIVAAGHVARGVAALHAAGLEAIVFDAVEENPTTRHVDQCVAFARQQRIDLLVGLGGGSSMDCAKGCNFIVTNGGRMQEYRGVGKATKPMLPMIAAPTTAGTGSEAQSFALIADEQTHQKMACGDKKAACRAAVLDPVLTVTQPRGVTAATGIDAISHALETAVTRRRNAVSLLFSREAWRLLAGHFETVLRDPANLDARGGMLLGAHWAGAAIENSMLGATHACANPLTAHYGITHGVAIGLMLPHVIRFNAAVAGATYAEFARLAGLDGRDDELPGMLADRVGELVRLAGQPTRLRDCDVSAGLIPLLAGEAATQWTGTFNPRPAGGDEFEELYRCAL